MFSPQHNNYIFKMRSFMNLKRGNRIIIIIMSRYTCLAIVFVINLVVPTCARRSLHSKKSRTFSRAIATRGASDQSRLGPTVFRRPFPSNEHHSPPSRVLVAVS